MTETGSTAVVVSDLESFATTQDSNPWDYYEQLRALGDVVWDEREKAWLVSSYDLIKEMWLANDSIWQPPFVYDPQNPPMGLSREKWTQLVGPGKLAFTLQDGEVYDRMHRWWFRIFSPRVLEHWGETLIEPIANAQIDEFVENGRVEFLSEYYDQVTIRVMIAILGLPWRDEEWLERFISLHRTGLTPLFESQTHPTAENIESALNAVDEMRAMVMPFVQERKDGEGSDFISMIWRAGSELFGTDDFTEDDVLSHAFVAFIAGSGSVGSVVGNTLYVVMTHDGLQEQVLAGGEKALRTLVEETLRLYSQVEWRFRHAKVDTVLGGVPIKKGDMVIALNASGNRDPEHYSCPHQVDLERRAPRDHFGFLKGARTCPGQSLARFELDRIVKTTLERLPELRLDPDAEPARWKGGTLRGWVPLHALFDPSERPPATES
jgi:cytochrome P450